MPLGCRGYSLNLSESDGPIYCRRGPFHMPGVSVSVGNRASVVSPRGVMSSISSGPIGRDRGKEQKRLHHCFHRERDLPSLCPVGRVLLYYEWDGGGTALVCD